MWASLAGLSSRSDDLLKAAEPRARAAEMQSVGSDWLELRGKGAIEVRHGALHRSKSARGLYRPAVTLVHSSWSHSAQSLVKEQPVLYLTAHWLGLLCPVSPQRKTLILQLSSLGPQRELSNLVLRSLGRFYGAKLPNRPSC